MHQECIKSLFPAIHRKEIFVHGICTVFGLLWTKTLPCLSGQPVQLSIPWGSLPAPVPDTAAMSGGKREELQRGEQL